MSKQDVHSHLLVGTAVIVAIAIAVVVVVGGAALTK